MKQKLTPADRMTMITLYIDNAYEMLTNARDNIDHGYYKGAVNRLYYAAYYIVTGFLLGAGIEANTHSGAFNQFSLLCIHSGLLPIRYATIYRRLLEERSKGDYDIFTLFDHETVEEYLSQAQEFVDVMKGEIAKQQNNTDPQG